MTSTMIPMMANTICTTISPMVSPFLVAILGAYACANRKAMKPEHRVVDGQGHHIAVRQHHAVQRLVQRVHHRAHHEHAPHAVAD